MTKFTHLNDEGQAHMVDVGHKQPTRRVSRASARIELQPDTLQAIQNNAMAKGDVLQVARLAAIMAAKQTSTLIPLCHPVGLDQVDVTYQFEENGIRVEAMAAVTARTGVEMEAMTAVSVASLTIYDMCKSIDRSMRITNVQLDEKSGGNSGHFVRKEEQ